MKFLRKRRFILLSAIALGVAAVSLTGAATMLTGYTWSNTAGGNWSVATNWSPNTGTPSAAADTATIGAAGAYTVTMNVSPTIAWVDVTNATASLNLGPNTLTLLDPLGLQNAGTVRANSGTGTIVGNITNLAGGNIIVNNSSALNLSSPLINNAGTILVNHAGSFDATLRFVANSTVSGIGKIQMNGDTINDRLETTGGAVLTNVAGHSIVGRGALAALLNNQGIVSANVAGQTLHMIEQNVTNTGQLNANGGVLRIAGIQVNNAGGSIVAQGSEVQLDSNAQIIGGAFSGSGFPIRATGNATLNGVSIFATGHYVLNNSTTTTLKGTNITNNGLITVNHAASFDAVLLVDDNLTLSGTGQVHVNGDTVNDSIDTTGTNILTNSASHLIRGRGSIRASLSNAGTVTADTSGGNFDMMTNPKTNTGTMRAITGGVLRFVGIIVQNAGGSIKNEGGQVHVTGSSIVGGTLFGTITATGNATLNNVAIAPAGQYTINSSTTTTLLGSTLVNDGTILLNHAGSFDSVLDVAANITLSGSGLLTMNGDTINDSINTAVGMTLTQANSHTIAGRGGIRAALMNHGVVRADVTNWTLELHDNDKHNPGVMQATNGGILRINGVDIDNGGRIDAVGGNVFLNGGAKIAGGNMKSTGTSLIVADGNATFLNVTLDAGSEYRIRNSTTTSLEGSFFTNNGKIILNESGSFDAAILALSNLTLGGSGNLQMNGDTDNDTIDTATDKTLTNASLHRIHGRGSIRGKVVNAGSIEANITNWTLNLLDKEKTNTGSMLATNGGLLGITGVALNNTGGTIDSTGGTVHFRNACSVAGGTIQGTGPLEGSGNATLSDLIIAAGSTYRVYNSTTTTLGGTAVTNNGLIVVNHAGSFDAVLDATGTVEIAGNGTVQLNGDTINDQVRALGGSKFIFGDDQKVVGRGAVRGSIENKGEIRANVTGWLLTLIGEGDGIVNKSGGLIENVNGGALDIQNGAFFENQGDVRAPTGHVIRVLSGNYRQTAGKTTVDGTLQISNGDFFMEGGELGGTGTVQGDVDNSNGEMSPGASAGTLTVQGTYSQDEAAKIKVEIASGTSADKLVVSGVATLDGIIEVALLDSFVPNVGTEYEIMTFSSMTGGFRRVVLTGFPDDRGVAFIQQANKLILRIISPTVVNPTSYSVTNAIATAPVSTLFGSDNNYLRVGASGKMDSMLTVETTAPAGTVTYIEIVVESMVNAGPMVDEKIEMFDFVANAWVEVSQLPMTPTDRVVRFGTARDVGRFIETGTRTMRTRMTQATTPWFTKRAYSYDQVIWRLG